MAAMTQEDDDDDVHRHNYTVAIRAPTDTHTHTHWVAMKTYLHLVPCALNDFLCLIYSWLKFMLAAYWMAAK